MSLRIGIVGCGKIADGHAEVIRNLPAATLVSVCDLEPIIAEQLAVRFEVPHWYSDLAKMLQMERLDVLHITTPPAAHLSITRQAVKAGCHVFLEKPLAPCLAQCTAIVEAVRAARKRLSINYWPNFESASLELQDYVASGLLGKPIHIESFIGYDLAGEYGQALMRDPDHWVHQLPGKLFQNMMDHMFNRITPYLPELDPEIQVTAFRARTTLREDVTDSMFDELRVSLRAGMVTAFASLSCHARPVANTLRIYGTKNTVELDYNRRTLIVEAGQQFPSAIGRLIPPFQMARRYFHQGMANLSAFRRSQFHFFAGMSTLLTRFYQSIVEDDLPPPISFDEVLRVAKLMDAVIHRIYPEAEP
jgi:predicted dehydrogenase